MKIENKKFMIEIKYICKELNGMDRIHLLNLPSLYSHTHQIVFYYAFHLNNNNNNKRFSLVRADNTQYN